MNGLSSRLRNNAECATWVFEAVQKLEAESARHLERLESALDQNARLIIDNQRLREELRMAEVFHRIAVKERDYERVVTESLRAEVGKLRAVIDFAPHQPNCASHYAVMVDGVCAPGEVKRLRSVHCACDCWKLAARGES